MTKKPAKFLPRLAAGFCAAGLLLALMAWGLVEYSRSELRAYRAELEKRGEEFSIEKLAPPRPKADEDANELLAAMQVLNAETRGKTFSTFWVLQNDSGKPGFSHSLHQQHSFKQGTKEISWQDIQREQAPLGNALGEIRKAAVLPGRTFTFDYARGPDANTTVIAPCITAGQWLGRENLRLLHEGRIAESVTNIEAMLSIARKLFGQTTNMSQLVGISVVSMASTSTWEVLAANPGEEELRRLAAAWQDIETISAFSTTLRIERCWGLDAFRSDFGTLWNTIQSRKAFLSSHTSAPPPSALQDFAHQSLLFVLYSTWSTFFRYADERQLLEHFQTLLDSREQNEDWNTLLAKSAAGETRISAGGVGNFYSRSTVSGYKNTLERLALIDTLEKLTRTAIALRRFQIANGNALPAMLDELVPSYLPAVPLDIMDHRPIRYRPAADGYLLYGTGPNGRDDGGNASLAPGKWRNPLENGLDIVWPQVAP